MKKILLALMLTILFVACGGSGKSTFTLDNPSVEKITVTIDGKEQRVENMIEDLKNLNLSNEKLEEVIKVARKYV